MDNNQFRGFEIIEELGSGAFSKTVLAEQNGKRAVIKTIEMPNDATLQERASDYVKSEEFAEAMRTAGTQLNRLLKTLVGMPDTTGLMRYYDYTLSLDSDKGIYTLAILMEHDTPLHVLLDSGEVPVGAVLRMASQLCEGLDAMHRKYVVHGNIKESNIFYNPRTGFMLGDFYINDILSTSLVPDRSFKSYGYRFLAPEAYEDGEYSFRTDIFSLGMMLYKIFNHNRLPFADAPNTSLRKVKSGWDEAKVLPAPAFDVPEITKMLAKATAYNADERYSTYLQFKAVIDRLLASLPKEVLYTKLSASVQEPLPEPKRQDAEQPDAAKENTQPQQESAAAEDSAEKEQTPPIVRKLKRVPAQIVAQQTAATDVRLADYEARELEENKTPEDENPLISPSIREDAEADPVRDRPVRPLVRHYEPPAGATVLEPPSATDLDIIEKRKRRAKLPNDNFNYFDYNSEEYTDPAPGKARRRVFFIALVAILLAGLAVGAGFLVKYLAG